jgi:hypothetical protein
MALMLLGIVARPHIEDLPRSRSKSLSSLWGRVARNYFVGTNPKELKSTLDSYARHIDCRIHRKNCVDHTLETLGDSGTVIIGIEAPDFDHWVLAVGVGGTELKSGFKPSSLLVLDPGYSPIRLAAWNSTLDIKPDRQGQHSYKAANSNLRVRIKNILAIRPRNPS